MSVIVRFCPLTAGAGTKKKKGTEGSGPGHLKKEEEDEEHDGKNGDGRGIPKRPDAGHGRTDSGRA